MERHPLESVLEAMLFASGDAVSIPDLAGALGVDGDAVRGAADSLTGRLARTQSGLELVEVASGLQLRTRATHAEAVLKVLGGRPQRLSRAALEVLSIVAFQQPVTRGDVDAVRGVASGAVMKQLLTKGLVKTAGRRNVPGKPLEYRTTTAFLDLFSLSKLSDLPSLAERGELSDD